MAQKPLLDYLETLPDPRLSAKCSHVLSEVIFMATCAMMCGFDTWSEITLFAKEREQWFRRWLTLPGGLPSHDTFNRAFAILPPDSLKAIFQDWIGDILENEQISGQVAIDGKALRATAKGKGANSVHMVNAWSTELGLCIGQQKVAKKSNEITAIPELLQQLEIAGCLISIDAAGTQVKIADTILKRSADYLLAVKGNQLLLSTEVQARFEAYWNTTETDILSPEFSEQFDSQHGRKERRRCWRIPVDEHMPECQKWKAKSIIAVQSDRLVNGKGHDSVRFYISSRELDAETALKATRGHWAEESLLHWTLDIAFNEDQLKARAGNAGQNLAVIRQWILNMLKRNTSRQLSMANKRKLCCLNDDYLFTSMSMFIL